MQPLLSVYAHLISWTVAGWLLGRTLPATMPSYLGKFLFWIGVPISIIGFLRQAQVSWSLWLAPAISWTAMLLGLGLAWSLMQWQQRFRKSDRDRLNLRNRQTQGSFLLAAMVGNTGYIGYPVSLAFVGQDYFAWALFYDAIGSTLGAYGLGVVLASRFGTESATRSPLLQTLLENPALWSFAVGLIWRDLPLPSVVETSLRGLAWAMVALALVLVGMRLSQLTSLKSITPGAIAIAIKMLIVPLILGTGLWAIGVRGAVHQVILLQMAMPPAFATLVLAEAYDLDQDLTVTTLLLGCLGLLLTLPFWLWLFGS
jgi:predicted permease